MTTDPAAESAAADRSEKIAGRRKLFVKSYGCQMNVYDATRMADVLAPEGYDETGDTSASARPRRSFPNSARCAR